MEFVTFEEFPFDLFAGFEADSDSQGYGDKQVGSFLLSFGANSLDFNRIFYLLFHRLACRLLPFLVPVNNKVEVL